MGSVMANLCGSHYPLHMAMVSIQPKGINRQDLLSAQVCKTGSDVASLTQVVEENPRNSAERTEG